jgi:hypothetical protein
MKNIYKHSTDFPYHISVGAVLCREDGAVACQYYSKETIFKITGIERDIYTLMRETVEEEKDETILEALHRGLEEELGVKGIVRGYLGSLETYVLNETENQPENFKKTTLYFLVDILSDQALRIESSDTGVTFVNGWMEPLKLIELMDKQSEGLARTDLNESEIIKRALSVK